MTVTVEQLLQLISKQQQQIPTLSNVECYELGDQSINIEDWMQQFSFAVDCASPDLQDALKVKLMMTKLSKGAFSEYKKSCLPKEVTAFSFAQTGERLKGLFAKPQSVWIDRYECLRAAKSDDEDFRTFVNRHKRLLRDFEFRKLNEEQFYCLMLLTSMKSPKDAELRKRLLAKLAMDGDNAKYDKVVEDLQMYLSTIAEAKCIEQPASSKQVYAVRKKFQPKSQAFEAQGLKQKVCWRCGKATHAPKECPHIKSVCKKCSKVGHLEAQCSQHQAWLNKNRGSNQGKRACNLTIGGVLVNVVNQPKQLIEFPVEMNGKEVKFLFDSGAEVTVVNEETHCLIGKPRLSRCYEQAKYHDGSKCTLLGRGEAMFKFSGAVQKGHFYVSKKGSLNLLGIGMLGAFGLMDDARRKVTMALQVNTLKKDTAAEEQTAMALKAKFPHVFSSGLGRCTRAKAHLSLKEGAAPVYCRPRPAPYNTRLVVEAELDRLQAMNVIRPVEHTSWAAPIVVVKKASGSTRVCADFSTGLNNALRLHQHPLPIPEDIFATLNGGRVFSQIDLSDAYLQVELDETSKEFCTIATHRGNFQYQRLPFGVKSAPGIFQSIMDSMLADCQFAIAYLDDVIVVSRSPEEHGKHLEEVFKRIEQFGFRVKPEKCSFGKERIKFLGFIVDKDGRRPDPANIQAISEMPEPTDVSKLRSFLGMVNHYQQFVKNMRFIRHPMDTLLKQDVVWNWSKECQDAFKKVIKILQSDQLLTHYDPSQEIVVSADASEHGIGAVISHRYADGKRKAIAHASHSLSPAEKNYAQIEKEGLALVFAAQKFHKYLYGRHFVLQTDHKPLLAIFGNKKGIKACTANRLQRWALILLGYDFDIEYQNTLEFGQADALSRLISKTPLPDDEIVVANTIANSEKETLNAVVKQFPITSEELVEAVQQDQMFQNVLKFIRTQWPNNKSMSEDILPFHRRRDSLTIEDECLLYAGRVVIPASLQKEVLQQLHRGHPGIKRMKNLARQYVYWPGMDRQIEDLVRSCQPCASEAKAPGKTLLHSWPKAEGPWKRVHMDYAGPFDGKMFLIVVDAYSKWPEVFEMNSTGSTATIDKLRYLCARHGLPETVVTDNGTQFASREFREFTKGNGISHLFSAPYCPMSNGQAERFVDTFKRTCRSAASWSSAMKPWRKTSIVAMERNLERSSKKRRFSRDIDCPSLGGPDKSPTEKE
uniref:RNA-directed DNA polymerase n=1 Tax=Globodera rostochiensis TaxID=31243 RepID=A0A914HFX2_GLORO